MSENCVAVNGQYPDEPGAELLDDIRRSSPASSSTPPSTHSIAHTLWIAHTWLMDAWDSTPRIAFLSPEPGSGKSRALEVTEPLVPRPVHAVNTTPAYLFRKVSDEAGPPTILYDEIDTVFGPKAKDNEDIRGMLNAGHRKGAMAGRCVSPRQDRRNRGAARLLRRRPRRARRPARHDHDALGRRAHAAALTIRARRAVAAQDQRTRGRQAVLPAARLGQRRRRPGG